jgi:hypothetical protein
MSALHFFFHYSRCSHVPDISSDLPYYDVSSSSIVLNPHLPGQPDVLLIATLSVAMVFCVVPGLNFYRDAMSHPKWQLAMVEEIVVLERTSMWNLISPPPRICPITYKWVYKIKTRSDASLERYKTFF